MKVECEVANANRETRIDFENIGEDSECVQVSAKTLKNGEWTILFCEIFHGDELIKAIQKAQFC